MAGEQGGTSSALLGMIPGAIETAGLVAQVAGNKQARKDAARQNQKQREWEHTAWNLSNEYNNPTNQMARLKAAGLNPNLVYGNGAEGGITSPMDTPSMQEMPRTMEGINLGESLGRIYDTTMKPLQKDLMQIEMAAKAQSIAESVARTVKTSGVDTLSGYQNIYESGQRIEASKAGVKATEAGTEKTKQETAIGAETLRNAYRMSDVNLETAEQALGGTKLDNARKAIENSNLNEIQKTGLKEAYQRIKESESRLGIQGMEEQLKKEQLELRKKGVETHDPIWARIISNIVDNVPEVSKGTGKLIDETRKLRR